MAHGGRDLPQELVFRILVLLPVKSLLRFACVCRLWNDVILRDRNFALAQLEAARERRSHHRILMHPGDDDGPPQLHIFQLEAEAETKTSSFLSLPGPPKPVLLLGSCNGVVFLTPFVGGGWVASFNPSKSNSVRILPDPEFDLAVRTRPERYKIKCNNFSGAGYVSATDDYKLLIAHVIYRGGDDDLDYYDYDYDDDDSDDDDFEVTEVKLYSMRSNSWKSIDSGDVKCLRSPSVSTVVRERLHWIDYFGRRIAAFNLGNEEFVSLSMPDHYYQGENEEEFLDLLRRTYLGVSGGGCLTLMTFPKYDAAADINSFIELWVMNEYGVAQSWTMLIRFRCPLPNPIPRNWSYIHHMLTASTFHTLVMKSQAKETVSAVLQAMKNWRLIHINHEEKQEQQFQGFDADKSFSSYWTYNALEYEESLI